MERSRVLRLGAGGWTDLEMRLRPLEQWTVAVTSTADQEPIEGARVGPIQLLQELHHRELWSPLAKDFFRTHYLATTDEQGLAKIGTLPAQENSLWIEADGYSPRLLSPRQLEEPASPLRVSLSSGGSIEIHFEEPPPENGRYKLLLRSKDAHAVLHPPSPAAALFQYILWGEATVSWPSVPAGTYEVILKGTAEGRHSISPATLGSFVVGHGRKIRKSVNRERLPWTEPARTGVAEVPDLVLKIQDPSGEPLQGTRLWRLTRETEQEVSLIEHRAVDSWIVPNGCAPDITYVVETPDLTSGPIRFATEACLNRNVQLVELQAAAKLVGTLSLAPGLRPEPTAQVILEDCSNGGTFTSSNLGPVPAHVTEDFHALLPPGCFNLRFSFPGAASQTFPQVKLLPEKEQDLGEVRLSPDAALLARILDPETREPIKNAVVEAFPSKDFARVAKETYTQRPLQTLSFAASTDGAGWARLFGLPTGSFRLRARSDDPALAPVFYGPVELKATTETLVPELALAARSSVYLTIDSAPDSLDDCSYSVRATLNPGCGWLPHALVSESLPHGDSLTLDGLPPGRWRVATSCQLKSGAKFTVSTDETDLIPGTETIVAINLAGAVFHGRILQDGEPVRAYLEFLPDPTAPPPGMQGSVPSTYSDHEGEFVLGTAFPGNYLVRVRRSNDQIPLILPEKVELSDPENEIIVQLPTGSIRGSVVDELNRPLAGALVLAQLTGGSEATTALGASMTSSKTRKGGTFELLGLSAGLWRVSAASGINDVDAGGTADLSALRASPPTPVELAQGGTVDNVVLVVGAPVRFTVQVRNAQGAGIAGAKVTLTLLLPSQPPKIYQGNADFRGQFHQVLIPDQYEAMKLTVQAPGFAQTTLEGPFTPSPTVVMEEEVSTRDAGGG